MSTQIGEVKELSQDNRDATLEIVSSYSYDNIPITLNNYWDVQVKRNNLEMWSCSIDLDAKKVCSLPPYDNQENQDILREGQTH
jgi:hypothetical protein